MNTFTNLNTSAGRGRSSISTAGRTSTAYRRRHFSDTQKARANLLGMSPEELQEYNTERDSRPVSRAQYLIAEEQRAEQLGIMMYEQAKMLGGQPYFGNKQQDLTKSQTADETKNYLERQYRQTLVTANISTLRFREIPRAIQLKMVALFKKSLISTALLPFTFAAKTGHVLFVEPIIMVVTDTYDVVKRVYGYFFFIIMIFGVRHYYIHYANDNPYIQTAAEAVKTYFPYFIAPSRWVVNMLSFFIGGSVQQIRNNASGLKNFVTNKASSAVEAAKDKIQEKIEEKVKETTVGVVRNALSGGYKMAQSGFCLTAGRLAPVALGCSA